MQKEKASFVAMPITMAIFLVELKSATESATEIGHVCAHPRKVGKGGGAQRRALVR